MTANWLVVDEKGYAQNLRNKGVPRIMLELPANGFDAKATAVSIVFKQEQGWANLAVSDNGEGFATLSDAYTLFAPSTRRADVKARGRFGQGDKEMLAICHNGGMVQVVSTKGGIRFNADGRRSIKARTTVGTEVVCNFRCTKAEATEFDFLVRSLIIPSDVKVTYNGEVLPGREPIKVVNYQLQTKVEDEEGNLSDTRRFTDIELYEPEVGETSFIYELGMPVVEHDGRWHINVMQKVPLNSARDNITPGYLRKLREIMLNETHDLLTSVDMKSAWVSEAKQNATEEALRSYSDQVYGKDVVIADPHNPESTKRAVDKGWTVLYSRTEDTNVFNRLKEFGIAKPAGQVIETGVPTSPDGVPPIPVEKWTPEMHHLAEYARGVGFYLLGIRVDVEFHNINVGNSVGHTRAWFGGNTITFNLRFLGKRWPGEAKQIDVDDLLLHEFSHYNTGHDHFSDHFIHQLSHLGAKLRNCPVHLNRKEG